MTPQLKGLLLLGISHLLEPRVAAQRSKGRVFVRKDDPPFVRAARTVKSIQGALQIARESRAACRLNKAAKMIASSRGHEICL